MARCHYFLIDYILQYKEHKIVSMNGRKLLNISRIQFLHISKYSNAVKKQTPAEYCFDLVRKNDYENFICTLFIHRDVRAAAFAIRAFNVEVAKVQDHIHDHKIGEMRLKFWSNGLNSTFKGKPPRSPVFLELNRILKTHPLSMHYFNQLVNARLEHLRNPMFLDMQAIERYADYSTTPIYYLIMEAYNVQDFKIKEAASHLGKAHGIINLIRSIPHNARNRVNMLPQDILMKHDISTEAIFQGEITENLKNAINDVSYFAKHHLKRAESLVVHLEERKDEIFFPTMSLNRYINCLHKVDYNVFDTKLQRRYHLLSLKLLTYKFFRVIV